MAITEAQFGVFYVALIQESKNTDVLKQHDIQQLHPISSPGSSGLVVASKVGVIFNWRSKWTRLWLHFNSVENKVSSISSHQSLTTLLTFSDESAVSTIDPLVSSEHEAQVRVLNNPQKMGLSLDWGRIIYYYGLGHWIG